MKTIGLLGGMSWESTISYYSMINTGIKERLGGLHSAKIVLYSVEFAEIEALQHSNQWDKTADILAKAAVNIEKAGADFLLICTNTMHKVAPQVAAHIGIPLLHIADGTAQALLKDGISKVGLLGTAYTMEQDFYKGRLTQNFGMEVIVPNDADRKIVHEVIFNELCLGQITASAKAHFVRIMEHMAEQGAQAVILGCTEIGLLIKAGDCSLPVYDTTAIHAAWAVEQALA